MTGQLSDPSLSEHSAFRSGECKTGERTFPVSNPVTGEEFIEVADLGAKDVRVAIDAAYGAQREWAARTAKKRCAIGSNGRNGCARTPRILTAEMVKPVAEARGEIAYGASFIQWFAAEGRRICGGVIPGHQNDKRIIVLGLSSATPSSARQAKR